MTLVCQTKTRFLMPSLSSYEILIFRPIHTADGIEDDLDPARHIPGLCPCSARRQASAAPKCAPNRITTMVR